MSSPDRRTFLALGAAALSGCGFTPVYGPGGGSAQALQGAVALDDPRTDEAFYLNQRLEERFGRATNPRYRLAVAITTSREDLGTTSDGRTTRFHLSGTARYNLRPIGGGEELVGGRTDAFTGYSATGSTVATLAAARDAEQRLMRILADQITDELVLIAGTLA